MCGVPRQVLGVPLEGVGDAEDVVDHGGGVGAGVGEGGAVRAAEVHRREEVAERAGQVQAPSGRRLHLAAPGCTEEVPEQEQEQMGGRAVDGVDRKSVV